VVQHAAREVVSSIGVRRVSEHLQSVNNNPGRTGCSRQAAFFGGQHGSEQSSRVASFSTVKHASQVSVVARWLGVLLQRSRVAASSKTIQASLIQQAERLV